MWYIVIEITWAGTLLSFFGGLWIDFGRIVVDVSGLATQKKSDD
jgi:succinate-acetate transporter protein